MGIIGTGLAFERLHYPAYQKLTEQYQIIAICDPDKGKTSQWRTVLGLNDADVYTDYNDMFLRDDIDAFDIMVPIELNYQVLEAVARTGKPAICEKPLAPTKEQAKLASRLPKKYNVPVMIAENYRYNEENNILRDLVRTKEVGEIYYFIYNRVTDFPSDMVKDGFAATKWRQHPEFPGGVLYDSGVHDIAALRHIFGAITDVQAFGTPQRHDFSPFTVLQANLKFASGVIGQFSFFTAGQEPQRPLVGLRAFGTTGSLYLEEPNCGVINVFYNNGTNRQIPFQPEMGFYNELMNFYQAATDTEPISVPPEMEYGDANTIFALLESAKTNQVISVDKTSNYVLA